MTYPSKQCAAVRTQSSEMMVPRQKYMSSIRRPTIQGYLWELLLFSATPQLGTIRRLDKFDSFWRIKHNFIWVKLTNDIFYNNVWFYMNCIYKLSIYLGIFCITCFWAPNNRWFGIIMYFLYMVRSNRRSTRFTAPIFTALEMEKVVI